MCLIFNGILILFFLNPIPQQYYYGPNNCNAIAAAVLAIIPLQRLLAIGAEELALRVGQTLRHLLNVTGTVSFSPPALPVDLTTDYVCDTNADS